MERDLIELCADRVGIDRAHGALLQPTSLRVASGQVALIAGEPGTGHTAFALAMAGRIRSDHGAVLINGKSDLALLRHRVAVVDSLDITEPDGALLLPAVIGEELALASAPANRRAVTSWITRHQLDEFRYRRFDQLPAPARTQLLTEIAANRPGVNALIIDLPERHITAASTWWATALNHARNGLAVVVTCTNAAARQIPIPAAHLGSSQQPEPLTVASIQEIEHTQSMETP